MYNKQANTHTMSTSKTQILKQQLQLISGINVDITIRGKREFTFSYEGENKTAMQKIVNFFKNEVKSITATYEADIDYTCIFLTV